MTLGQRDKLRREKARTVINARKKRREALVKQLMSK